MPDEEVENYFEENYTSYAYIIRPLYHTADTSGETSSSSLSESTSSASSESSSSTSITAMTEEEIAAAEQEFDDFAAKITSGEMTAQQAADQYKEAAGLDAEQLTEGVEMLSTDTGAPEELVTLLDSLDAGEAGTTEVSLGTQKAYLLAVKYDISQETQTALEDADKIAITHEEIANHLGSAREVVSRMLKYFEREGMVKLSRGAVELTDREALAKRAGERNA